MPNEKIIEFDLNFIPQGVPPIVHVHQYDVGTIVTLKPTLYYGKDVYDGIDLSACTTIIAYARPDGTKQSYTIYPTVDQNVISFPLDNQMTAVWGPNVMSVGFQSQNHQDVLWTQNFILSLERHPIQAEDYVGSNAFEGMIQTLQQYVDTAYAATPPGYEEHIAKIQAVESAIDDLRDDIRESAEEANEYVDNKISGLDSIYQTLEDAQRAAEEGRAYAGTLVGDLGTQIISDMSLMYTTKDESNSQIAGLEIYAEQVTEASATELREHLGIEYTETGVDFVENSALSAEITKRANEIKQELSAEFVTENAVEGVVSAYADSAITQKANEILLEVHQNYETKEDADDKLLTAQSYTDSQLSISSNQIRTEVNAYTDETIRNLKIGATNLLRGTNEYKTTDESQTWVPSYNNGGWAKTGTATVSELSDPPGNGFTTQVAMGNTAMLSQNNIDWFVDNKNYAAHMWIKKPISEDATGDQFLWFRNSTTGEKIPMSYTDADDNVISTITYRIHNPSHEEKAIPGDIAGNFIVDDDDILGLDDGSTTYTVEDEDSEWLELDVYFSNKEWPESVDVVVGNGQTAFTFAGLKIEEGNKITAWQPNEFDIKNYVNTSITQTNERITLLAEAQAITDGTVNNMNSRLDVEAGKIAAMVSAGYIEPDGNNGWTSTYSTNQLELAMTEVSDRYNIDANTIAALQTGISNNGQSLTLYSRWMTNLGVENLLRATDLCEELNTSTNAVWSLADDKHGWYDNTGNGNTVTRIDLSSTDRPFNNVTRAWRMSVASSATLTSHTLTQYDVPVVYQKEYTISVYARCTSGSASIRLQASRPGESHVGAFDISAADNSSWTLFKYTFTHDFEDSKNYVNIDIGLRNNYGACVVEFCAMKLELGGIPTTWCPSVFDVEAQTQAFIEVESNRITQQVSDLSGNISRIEETATGIQLTVANMQVGGTNLCLDSKKDANQSHNTYNLQDFNLEESLIAGKTYTVSARITLSSERQQVGFFHSGGTYSMVDADNNTWIAKTDGTAIYKRTFVATADMASQTGGAGHGFVRVYSSTTTGGVSQGSTPIAGTGHVDWIKLEEGNMASGWSPAPGDMQEAMDGNDVITLINLSSTTATIQAKHIDLNGAVTFSSLATDAQNKINAAQSTANNALTKANAADTTLTDWCYNNNKTYIDGSNLYTGTVNTSALNLYGELQILQSKTGSTGGYMGYETGHNGVSNTDGMLMRAGTNSSTTFDSYAWKNTYKSYLHLSDSGAIIRSPYIQLRQSGTQAVKIINDNGLNLKEYGGGYSTTSAVNSSDVLGKMAITAQSFASDDTRADLTINAKTLKFNASSNNFYFMPYTSGDTIFIQHHDTCNESQIGSSSPNNTMCWSHGWFKAVGYTGLYNLSDKRSKTDITYGIDGDKIDLLKPASFRYKEGIGNDDNIHYGFIAQDVLEIYPDLVNQWCEDRYDLDYNGIIPLLVDKCQKLQKQIDNLEEALSSK